MTRRTRAVNRKTRARLLETSDRDVEARLLAIFARDVEELIASELASSLLLDITDDSIDLAKWPASGQREVFAALARHAPPAYLPRLVNFASKMAGQVRASRLVREAARELGVDADALADTVIDYVDNLKQEQRKASSPALAVVQGGAK